MWYNIEYMAIQETLPGRVQTAEATKTVERPRVTSKDRPLADSLARHWASVLLFLGAAGGTAYAVNQYQSGEFPFLGGASNTLEAAFTPEAKSGKISTDNTQVISIETINQELEKQKAEGKATETTLLFPLVPPTNSNGTSYYYEEINKGFDPKTGKNIMDNNKNWMQLQRVDRNTTVVMPIDDAEVFSYGPKIKTGMVQGIGIKFIINDTVYTLKITGTTLSDMIFKDLNNLPSLREYQNNEGRVHFKRGTPLLVLENSSDVQMTLDSTPVGSTKNEEKPVPLDFLSTLDEDGNNKLVVLSN